MCAKPIDYLEFWLITITMDIVPAYAKAGNDIGTVIDRKYLKCEIQSTLIYILQIIEQMKKPERLHRDTRKRGK